MQASDVTAFLATAAALEGDLPEDGPSPDRILELAAPPPDRRMHCDAWPASSQTLAALAERLGETHFRILLFNKCHPSERLCPLCRTRYRAPEAAAGGPAPTRAEREQALSGICSARCFSALNGPEGFSVDEWLGQAAQSAQIAFAPGGSVVVHVVEREDGALETRRWARGTLAGAAAPEEEEEEEEEEEGPMA